MNRITASIYVLIAAASYGMLSPLVKWTYQLGFSPAHATGSQVFFGMLSLWFCLLFTLSSLKKLSWNSALKLLAGGAVSGFVGIFYYLALQKLPASIGIVLLFQFTWMGVLLDSLLQRKLPGKSQLLAIVLILAGTVLAANLQPDALQHLDWFGVIFALLSAVIYTGFIYFSSRVATEVPSLIRGTLMMTGGAITILTVYPPKFLFDGSLGEGLLVPGLLMGIFGGLIPSYFFAKGAPHIGPGWASILGSLELPVVILLSAFVLMEPVTWFQWLGTGLILGGIAVSEGRGEKERKT